MPKPTILIVEDDFLVASDIQDALETAGFTVVGAAVSAQEAISAARTLKPSIAIMDIRLAGDRDGVDTAIELFREHGIRCLFATAHSDEKTRSRAEPARPLGWLAKPYSPDALVELLRKVIAD